MKDWVSVALLLWNFLVARFLSNMVYIDLGPDADYKWLV
ncbi:hypothetical protein COMA2_80155 [Candidatus Nitrospira nitrificans]|uniref:Uncharacterized protein n=1 Tax=Candidatus Nitrospira nitrificans TaxID=1742973 RepID=A0A0S4LQ99_9BACT|nr:hypothetical protein COMA2_80155 [Candidatus Nitrospira nitrificans]